MGRTNVIIPFYQRERGILPVAVRSALAQEGCDLIVTVVDDGSPVSARDELTDIIENDPRLVVIEQPNGGAGAARNHGLDATPDDVEYIAFLDSDDCWLPGHLANGMTAMQLGADLYFADYQPLDTNSRFVQVGFSGSLGTPVAQGQDIFFYEGDLIPQMVPRSPVGTQTVMFRRSAAPDLRFRTDLYNGQDVIFWMELARRTRKIAFSTGCACICGRGINIAAAANWGTPEGLRRTYYWTKMYRVMLATFPLSRSQICVIDEILAGFRRGFASNMLHLLRRHQPVDWRLVALYVVEYPQLMADLLAIIGKKTVSSLHLRRRIRS